MKSSQAKLNKLSSQSPLVISLMALIFSLLLGMVVILVTGYSPLETYRAIFGVSLGTVKGFALSLSQATPLMFTGIAFALAFKVKLINTGAEGQLFIGAMSAALVGIYVQGLPPLLHVSLALLAGFLAGGILAGLVAIAKVYTGSNEIILTLMLNQIVIFFTGYLANGPLKPAGSGVGQTERIQKSAELTKLVPQTQVTTALFLVIFVAILLQIMLDKTVFGYEIKVTGQNFRAAQVAGINTSRISILTFAISGAVAGLGGAAMVLGVNYRFVEGFSPGYGFAGISIAALAAYSPLGVIPAAFLIGILRAGTITLGRTTSIPVELVDVIQVLVIIFVAAPALTQAITGLFTRFKRPDTRSQGTDGGETI